MNHTPHPLPVPETQESQQNLLKKEIYEQVNSLFKKTLEGMKDETMRFSSKAVASKFDDKQKKEILDMSKEAQTLWPFLRTIHQDLFSQEIKGRTQEILSTNEDTITTSFTSKESKHYPLIKERVNTGNISMSAILLLTSQEKNTQDTPNEESTLNEISNFVNFCKAMEQLEREIPNLLQQESGPISPKIQDMRGKINQSVNEILS